MPFYYLGIPASILSGDIFYDYDYKIEENDIGSKCCFLITINGVLNGNKARNRLMNMMKEKFKVDRGVTPTVYRVNNPTMGPNDFVQVITDEAGIVSYPSIRTAQLINRISYEASSNCRENFEIYIVAHSQGTAVFRNSLPFIEPEAKKHIKYYGIGGQRLANDSWGVRYDNYMNYNDIVILNMLNPGHDIEAIINLFDSNTHFDSSFRWELDFYDGHTWENNYIDKFEFK